MKILVTGSNGQLGSEIKKKSKSFNNFDWVFSSSDDFDFLKLNTINEYLNKIKPSIIINCAAYTKVDMAELDFKLADTINNKAVDLLSKWTRKNKKKLIHLSTDYVFSGKTKKKLNENSSTKPLNEYGKSKLRGELACVENDSNSLIIRTSWLYSSFGNNFVKKIIELMKTKKKLNIVNDQIGSPTYAADLAQVIIKIISSNIWIPGIYNFSNKGKVSWYDLANDIKSFYDFSDNNIKPISSKNYFTKAKRQNYSLLNNSKIKKNYKLKW